MPVNDAGFQIALPGLHNGLNEIEYDLDDAFFARFEGEDISSGSVKAEVEVAKGSLQAEFTVRISGDVTTVCDRCLDPLVVHIENEEQFVARVGLTEELENEDSIILSQDNPVVDLSSRLYQMCVVALPLARVHRAGECNEAMIEILRAHEAENNEKSGDPRWDALKNINK